MPQETLKNKDANIPKLFSNLNFLIDSFNINGTPKEGRTNSPLSSAIRDTEKMIAELKQIAAERPQIWGRYQKATEEFLDRAFAVCNDIDLHYSDSRRKLNQFKKLFIKHFRPYLRIGKLNRHVIDSPHGYAGDYEIIDAIYRNRPDTDGMAKCLDEGFLTTPASVATRNRKEDFIRIMKEAVLSRPHDRTHILNLASGPCRDILELLSDRTIREREVIIDCVDHDPKALEYGKNLMPKEWVDRYVSFYKIDAVRLALAKDPFRYLKEKYDLIISTGLFDYLADKVAVRLISNLKALLKKDGRMVISNYRDKTSNPSRVFMEWGGDWNLIYRTESEFLSLFERAGFNSDCLSLQFEKQRIMQYCVAKKIE